MLSRCLVTVLSPLLLAILFTALAFLTLRPAQAAPSFRPNQADVLVTTTIQAAINAATPGDTVIVPAGTYTESLTLSKAVSLTGVNSATTIIHALPNQRVLTITGATINNKVVVSDLTLTGGKATDGFGYGGGIWVTDNAQPLLQKLIVCDNQASNGGGILVDFDIPLTLTNVAVISNSATTHGGGLLGGGPITASYSRFERNTAINGGGGGLVAAALTLTHPEFISNTASGFGGGLGAIGPAILIGGTFEGNTSSSGGGGLFADSALELINTQFLRNRAKMGGGVYYAGTSNGQFINALFAGNTVTDTGAALYLNSSGQTALLHITIANVSLNPKAAITVVSGTVGVTNTIIASHTVGISQTAGTTFEDYNLFFGNTLTTAELVASGGHSFSGDPKFTAPASDDYHLDVGSAALNVAFVGLVSNDFEGDLRPLGDGPDIGFDESSFSPTLAINKTVNPVSLLTPGETLTYTIVISNSGEAIANNVLISDTLPISVTGTDLFTTATILPNRSVAFTLPAIIATDGPSMMVITNTAFYSHTSGNGQASATVIVRNSELNFWTYLPLILKN